MGNRGNNTRWRDCVDSINEIDALEVLMGTETNLWQNMFKAVSESFMLHPNLWWKLQYKG